MGQHELGASPPPLPEPLVVLAAPTQVWSHHDGSMGSSPVHGAFHGEWRYLRALELLVDRERVERLAATLEPGGASFRGSEPVRDLTRPRVERTREVTPGGVVERATVANDGDQPIAASIELAFEIAFARIADVRSGRATVAGVDVQLERGVVTITDGTRSLRVRGRGGELAVVDDRVVLSADRILRPADWCTLELELELEDLTLAVRGVLVGAPCTAVEPTGRASTDRWSRRAVADLESLLLDAGHGAFLAAGAPWHLTLSAREALTAARLLLPLGTRIAKGTLRTLTARQGVRHDPATGEEPGRILHELRQHRLEAQRPAERLASFTRELDETPLWIVLLHDAWRAGLPLETVRELRLGLHAALWWLRAHSGTGFLQSPQTDRDAATGSPGPVDAAVQALACRAAVGAAALLDALGDDGDPWRAWAEALRRRFRAAFWVTRDGARFPAASLDDAGAPVATLGAALGQLLGSTLLDRDEERIVARLLLDERLSSGFGLRTLAADARGYRPLAEHAGAVRPVDTAVAVEGLLRIGLRAEAQALAEQLERAADAFHGRLPEIYSGHGPAETAMPIALPGTCSPHAGSAAAVVPVRRALAAEHPAAEHPAAEHPAAEHPAESPIEPVPAHPQPSPTPSAEPPSIIARGGARTRRGHLRLVEPSGDQR